MHCSGRLQPAGCANTGHWGRSPKVSQLWCVCVQWLSPKTPNQIDTRVIFSPCIRGGICSSLAEMLSDGLLAEFDFILCCCSLRLEFITAALFLCLLLKVIDHLLAVPLMLVSCYVKLKQCH